MNRLQRRAEVLPEYPLRLPLTSVCHKAHEAATGAGDPAPRWVLLQYVRFLETVLETWEPSAHPPAIRYDEAIKYLVEATLAEASLATQTHAEEFPTAPSAGS